MSNQRKLIEYEFASKEKDIIESLFHKDVAMIQQVLRASAVRAVSEFISFKNLSPKPSLSGSSITKTKLQKSL